MDVEKIIKELKSKIGLVKKVTFENDSLNIGNFSIQSNTTGSGLYLFTAINTNARQYSMEYFVFTLLFFEELARENSYRFLLISPTIINHFQKFSFVFSEYKCDFLTAKDINILQEEGAYQANAFHSIKYITAEKNENVLVDIGRKISQEIEKIKKNEPRTSLSIAHLKGVPRLTFSYRESSISLSLIKKNNQFFLKFAKKNQFFPVNSEKEIEDSIQSILSLSYNQVRMKFLSEPPKKFFFKKFSFLSDKDASSLYDMLRNTMNFNEIEDVCSRIEKIHYRQFSFDSHFFVFHNTIYVLLEHSFSVFSMNDKEIAKKIFEDYVVDKTKNQIKNLLSSF